MSNSIQLLRSLQYLHLFSPCNILYRNVIFLFGNSYKIVLIYNNNLNLFNHCEANFSKDSIYTKYIMSLCEMKAPKNNL